MAFKPNNPICILLKKKHSVQEGVKNYTLTKIFMTTQRLPLILRDCYTAVSYIPGTKPVGTYCV